MATINYDDKVALNENSSIADINKVNASDMNLIKEVVNQVLSVLGLETQTWSSSGTYAIGDIVVYDNKLYQNITGTNTVVSPDSDTTNWEYTTVLVNN